MPTKTKPAPKKAVRPARPAPKKKARLRVNWGPILTLALLANVGAGLLASPITCPTKIRVVGVPPWDEARIRAILTPLATVPAAQINASQVESQAMAVAAVRDARFRRNLFGRGVLELDYRTPVAQLADAANTGVAADGTLFTSPSLRAGLPLLQLEAGTVTPWLALQRPEPMRALGEICAAVPQLPSLPENSEKPTRPIVLVDSRGEVTLNLGRVRARLGSHEDLDEKLAQLRRLLEDPRVAKAGSAEIKLIAPQQPTLVLRP